MKIINIFWNYRLKKIYDVIQYMIEHSMIHRMCSKEGEGVFPCKQFPFINCKYVRVEAETKYRDKTLDTLILPGRAIHN